MYIYISDKKIWMEPCFPEKISCLKKMNQIKFKINLYDNGDIDFNNQLNFFKLLTTFPESIYSSKSDYYFWCFDKCLLLDKKVYQDKNYYDYKGRDIKKWNIELTISYKEVFGSSKKQVIERDIKLKKLFNE